MTAVRSWRWDIAGLKLHVRAPARDWLTRIDAAWAPFAGSGAGSLDVEVALLESKPPRFSGALPEIRPLPEGGRELRGEGFVARFTDSGARIEQVDAAQPLDTLLKVLVADHVVRAGGVLLHCVALAKGKAAVLVGPSGAGKSTLGALGVRAGLTRLADELVAVTPEGEGHVATGTPWNIGVPQSRPLSWVGTLRFSSGQQLEVGEASAALRVLVSNMLVPDPSAEGRHQAFRNASALLAQVPVRVLSFAPEVAAGELVGSTL